MTRLLTLLAAVALGWWLCEWRRRKRHDAEQFAAIEGYGFEDDP
jgi:hypothetical protein